MTFTQFLPDHGTARRPITVLSDNPKTDLGAGLVAIAALASVFAGWTALAPLDAAATAVGRISVQGHDQIVANAEGGVVSRVAVVEGQHVHAGQVLVDMSAPDTGAEVDALSAQVISLQAQQARLLAELNQNSSIQWPAAFADLTGSDQATATTAMRIQQMQFDADQGDLSANANATWSAVRGLKEQISGGEGALAANERERALLDQQLAGVEGLAAKGFAPLNTVRSLQRSDAELAGAHEQLRASIAQYRQQIAQTGFSLLGARKQRIEATANALRQTEDELSAALPKLAAARAQLLRGTLLARIDGEVTGLSVFSPGAVVAPGQKLLEVVPEKRRLVVEAEVAANDTRDVHIGQTAQVRLQSLGSRGDPILNGRLTKLSADSFTDQKTGRSYYTAEVTVPESELKKLQNGPDDRDAVRPGLPVEVMIDLRPRTAFGYLFEPLTQSLWGAFRQR